MTDVVTRLVVRADGSLAVLDQFEKKMSGAGEAADMATGGLARFEAAQRRFQEAQQKGLAVTTESIARRTKEQLVFERAASAIDKNFALRIRLEREAEKSAVAMSNAVAAGYLRQEQALGLLMRQEQQHIALMQRGGVGGGNAAGMSRMGGSMSGLAAQFQDIGVTAAMGMNPLIIALQQGTQIAGQMEMAMQSGASAVGVLGTAFKSLISPVAIVSIGLTALAAAGLQMVDWSVLASGALNLVADGLVLIAPYAVAAAGGLALLYAPAIIGGIGTLIGSLGGIAKGIAGIATAIYATVGLPALLVAGFAAMVAGAVIWRDDLTKMLGVDIVGAAQTGINFIVGAFVGGFNGIKETWSALPAAIGDLVVQAANNALTMIESLLNSAGDMINNFLKPYNDGLALMGQRTLPTVGQVKFGRFDNPWENEAAKVGGAITSAMSSAIGPDYVGGGLKGIQDFASGAADALRGLADSLGDTTKESREAAKEAERQEKAYAGIVRDANQFIASKHLEAQALGMTAEAAARMRYEQELMNKAANDNISLTPAMRDELVGLAAQMAAVEEATRRVTEIYDFGKDVFTGFFNDLKGGLKESESFWEALGNAGVNALDKIAQKALDMAMNGIWDMIFGAVMGSFGGGMGGTMGMFGRSASTPLGFGGTNGIYLGAFATGGAGVIPGSGPTDSVLAMARVTPGEPYAFGPAAMRGIANQNQSNDNVRYGDINVSIERIEANSEAEGAAAARGFQREMKRWQDSGEGKRFVRDAMQKMGRAN